MGGPKLATQSRAVPSSRSIRWKGSSRPQGASIKALARAQWIGSLEPLDRHSWGGAEMQVSAEIRWFTDKREIAAATERWFTAESNFDHPIGGGRERRD